jgi:nitrate/nitrite transporter NarK
VLWSFPTRYLTAGTAALAIGLINAVGGLGSFTGPYLVEDIQSATGSFYLAYELVLASFAVVIACLFALACVGRKGSASAGLTST